MCLCNTVLKTHIDRMCIHMADTQHHSAHLKALLHFPLVPRIDSSQIRPFNESRKADKIINM